MALRDEIKWRVSSGSQRIHVHWYDILSYDWYDMVYDILYMMYDIWYMIYDMIWLIWYDWYDWYDMIDMICPNHQEILLMRVNLYNVIKIEIEQLS